MKLVEQLSISNDRTLQSDIKLSSTKHDFDEMNEKLPGESGTLEDDESDDVKKGATIYIWKASIRCP